MLLVFVFKEIKEKAKGTKCILILILCIAIALGSARCMKLITECQ